MKRITVLVMAFMMMASSATFASEKSDYELAKTWARSHCPKAKVEKVVTKSQGGYKGKAGRYTVRYPKKVAKGKKVTVYMVTKNGDVKAMVCLGKVK